MIRRLDQRKYRPVLEGLESKQPPSTSLSAGAAAMLAGATPAVHAARFGCCGTGTGIVIITRSSNQAVPDHFIQFHRI